MKKYHMKLANFEFAHDNDMLVADAYYDVVDKAGVVSYAYSPDSIEVYWYDTDKERSEEHE